MKLVDMSSIRFSEEELKPLDKLVDALLKWTQPDAYAIANGDDTPSHERWSPSRLQPLRDLSGGLRNIPETLWDKINRPGDLSDLPEYLAKPLFKMVVFFGPKVVARRIDNMVNAMAQICVKSEQRELQRQSIAAARLASHGF